ncbi:unnamed protein product [Cochlearia groenlandica]
MKTHERPESDIESVTPLVKIVHPTRRSWRVMYDINSMGFPRISRIQKNLNYFRKNNEFVVLIVTLMVIFINVITNPPISEILLLIFTVLAFVWILFYFPRDEDDEHVEICGFLLNSTNKDLLVLITIPFGFYVMNTYHIGVEWLIGPVVVLVHAVVRKTEDLFLEDEETAATTKTETSSS